MLTLTAAFLLASSAGEDCEPTPLVDFIEFNHTASGIDQIILWRFQEGGHHVAQWMRATDVEPLAGVVTWRSPDSHRVYVARCKIFRETTTMRDPEVEDRKKHPQELRVPYLD